MTTWKSLSRVFPFYRLCVCACVRVFPLCGGKGKVSQIREKGKGEKEGRWGLGEEERERVSCYGGVLLGVVVAAEMDRSASSFDFALLRELLTFARVPVAATTSARLAASTSYSSSCVRLVSSSCSIVVV